MKLGKFTIVFLLIALFGCKKDQKINKQTAQGNMDYSIDTSGIPNDTINFHDKNVQLKNGIYYLNENIFSGVVKKHLKRVNITTYSSVYKGMLHGTYKSFYGNGKPYETRNYKNNLATGRHFYYWKKTGNLKSDYWYYENKKEGKQKRWYESGKPFMFLNFKNDKLDGLQQAWRENGKLYVNYEAINGKNYGLQRSQLCYNLENEEIQ